MFSGFGRNRANVVVDNKPFTFMRGKKRCVVGGPKWLTLVNRVKKMVKQS